MKFVACIAFGLLIGMAAAPASDDIATAPAQAAAVQWLASIDRGEYAKSWDDAAALFRDKITQSDWEDAVAAVRKPLGAMTGRTFESAQPLHQLPGVPDGDYVVITYRTSFANRPDSVETITPMRETDGGWKVAGYFIK